MNSNKCVILLGAGFPTIWDAPVTSELTKRIRRRFSLNAGSITDTLAASRLYTQLTELLWHTDNSPLINNNFEDDIAFFESSVRESKEFSYLIEASERLGLIVPVEKQSDKIKRFIKYEGFSFDICSNDIDEYGYFMHSLLTHYVRSVFYELPYIRAIPTNEYNHRINNNLNNWLSSFDEYALRIYSLNYDQQIAILFPFLSFYNGFNLGKPESNKIMNFEGNVYYNLHGSFHFNNEGSYLKFNKEVELPIFPEDNNIICGSLNKPSKITNLEPLKSFLQKFESDIQEASKIYIVGYSASDKHINCLLKKVNVEPIVIDPDSSGELISTYRKKIGITPKLIKEKTEDFLWKNFENRHH